jgi:hypothetical protein
MEEKDYQELHALFDAGRLKLLASKLEPFLSAGDSDARFLDAHFELNSEKTDDEIQKRRKDTLDDLVGSYHSRSMFVSAWHHYHGDDGFNRDLLRFRSLLIGAALLGHKLAIHDVAEQLEIDMGWSGFRKRLGVENASD